MEDNKSHEMRLIYSGSRLAAAAFAGGGARKIKPVFPFAGVNRAGMGDLSLERQRERLARREVSGVWRIRNIDWLSVRQAASLVGPSSVTACSGGRGANACLFHVAVPYAALHAFQNLANTAQRGAGKAFETLANPPNLARYMFT